MLLNLEFARLLAQDKFLNFSRRGFWQRTEDDIPGPFEAGDPVLIEDTKGHKLGSGYINPHTLICARLVSRDSSILLDKSLLVHRIILPCRCASAISINRITGCCMATAMAHQAWW